MKSDTHSASSLPRLYSPYDRTMWESIAARRMLLQHCKNCQRWRYPPGACCPGCLSTESTWEPISGFGKILSWTTFHRQYLPAFPVPLTCVAVLLDEGPIMISNIDDDETGLLELDAPARMVYGAHPDGYVLPRFTLRIAADDVGSR